MATAHLEALAQAVEAQFPDRHGQRIAQSIRSSSYQSEPDLTWTDAGFLMAAALAGEDVLLGTLPLTNLELTSSIIDKPVDLDSDEVLAHRALGAWVGLDLASAIGALLRSGAFFHFQASDAPFVRSVEVAVAGAQVWAEITYLFTREEGVTLKALARYGDRSPEASASSPRTLPLASRTAISGGTLLAIGIDALGRSRALHAAPAVPDDAPAKAAAPVLTPVPVSGSLH